MNVQEQAAAFAGIHEHTGTHAFIDNLQTQVRLIDGMPVTINDGTETGNAWVCSPLTTYCDYAAEECRRYLHPLLALPLTWLCRAYGAAMRSAKIDRAVTVNNWLLSTNLYPPLDKQSFERLIVRIRQEWPDHAIWFRSLNAEQNGEWINLLRAHGFSMIPSRQVYFFDAAPRRSSADTRRDTRLLRTTALRRLRPGDFTGAHCERIASLYADLYLDKYSRLNPHYTAQFFQHWMSAGLLQFHGFHDESGQLQAVVGLFRQGTTITAPVVGYNTALPVKLGLYRLLMATVFEQAALEGCAVNLSAGAAHFKRLRGGRPLIECSAVLVRHLPLPRRVLIHILHVLTTWIGVPLMKAFKL